MLAYFISNMHSKYYETGIFQQIIQKIQATQCCGFKEKNTAEKQKIYLVFKKVNSINTALKILQNLIQ